MNILGFALLASIILTSIISAPLALLILSTNRDFPSFCTGSILLTYSVVVYFRITLMATNSSRDSLTETIAKQLLNKYKTGGGEE